MSESLEDVKREIARTRERMSQTVAEIEERVTAPVESVKQRTDVMRLIREHPWPALAVAFSAGVLVSATGADARAASATTEAARKAASATTDAAKKAAGATSRTVRDASQKLSSKLHREGGEPDLERPSEPGALDRLTDAVAAPIRSRFDDILDLLRQGSRELAAAMAAGSVRGSRRGAAEPLASDAADRQRSGPLDVSGEPGTPKYAPPVADAMPNTVVTTDQRDARSGGASVVELPPDTAADAIPVPPEMTPPELGVRAEAVEELGGGTHEPPLEPGAGELGAKWA